MEDSQNTRTQVEIPSSGLLLVDKPQSVTSHDIVAAARALLHTKKVGHAGTLDPMATGLLTLAFGNATRLLNYLTADSKTYLATIRFGQVSTTDDAEGEIGLLTEGSLPTLEELKQVVKERFTGEIEQVPNQFSAIKVHGKRAYDLAREGKQVQLKARPVTIYRFDVLALNDAFAADGTKVRDADVIVGCSAGTYIRALARDLGATFGCGAYLTALRRTQVGNFLASDSRVVRAHTEIKRFTNREGEEVERTRAVLECSQEELPAHVMSMEEAVDAVMPVVAIDAAQARELRFGRQIEVHAGSASAAVVRETSDVVAIVQPVGARKVKPVTVFPA